MLQQAGAGSFDLVFIDADTENYGANYKPSLQLLRPGGLILIDNANQDIDTLAIPTSNAALGSDDRIDLAMDVVTDGLTLAVKCRCFGGGCYRQKKRVLI